MDELDTSTIKALIIDDHPVVRYGVKHVLESEPDIVVVGELEDMTDIGTHIEEMQPAVVLLDL